MYNIHQTIKESTFIWITRSFPILAIDHLKDIIIKWVRHSLNVRLTLLMRVCFVGMDFPELLQPLVPKA